MSKTNPTCNTCNEGELKPKKKYRMSGPVVFIGYIFLIPSVIGMLIGVLGMVGTGGAVAEGDKRGKEEVTATLTEDNFPENLIKKVVEGEELTEAETAVLTQKQKNTLSSAKLSLAAGQLGTGIGAAMAGGFMIFIIISSFVGGLLGWLLIMKKKVLQCSSCNAIVAAS